MHNYKVGILNTYDISGGAARAAHGLYSSLKSQNIEVNYFVKHKSIKDDAIKIVPDLNTTSDYILQKILNSKISEFRTAKSNTLFNITYTNSKKFPYSIFYDYNILNLHWITNFLSPEVIHNLSKLKHLVWTLHDNSTFTGGCHYTSDCTGYTTQCEQCEQTNFPPNINIPHLFYLQKLKFLAPLPITFVVPSIWMQDLIKKSSLFTKHRVEYIPYSIDTETSFYPISKILAKRTLGIPTRKITILFSADNGNEIRKGFSILLGALQLLINNIIIKKYINSDEIQLLYLGSINPDIKNLGIPWISIERINDNEKLNNFYNSGDILILPSIEDNLPLTMIESLSAGTPVVAFKVGGMMDIIKNGVNGELVETLNSESLAIAIIKCIENMFTNNNLSLSDSSRKFAKEMFTSPKEAEKYIQLYNDLINNKFSNINLNVNYNISIKKLFFTSIVNKYILYIFEEIFIKFPIWIYLNLIPEKIRFLYRSLKNKVNK